MKALYLISINILICINFYTAWERWIGWRSHTNHQIDVLNEVQYVHYIGSKSQHTIAKKQQFSVSLLAFLSTQKRLAGQQADQKPGGGS